MQLRIEREELPGREVGGIHRVEHGVRVARWSASASAASASTTADSSTQPRAHDVVEREPVRGDLQPQQRRHAAARRGDDDRAGGRARAGAGAHEPQHLEHAQRLADARAADAEAHGELALGRKAIAGRESPFEQVGLDALEHESATRATAGAVVASMRPPSCGLTTVRMWSDHSASEPDPRAILIAWIPLALVLIVAGVTCAGCWIASLLTKDTSWVDRIWSIVPAVYVWIFAIAGIADGERCRAPASSMALLVTAWGARLTFNFARKGGYTGMEDYRWAILRGRMKPWQFQLFNLFFIVLYQNALLVLITLPASSPGRTPRR